MELASVQPLLHVAWRHDILQTGACAPTTNSVPGCVLYSRSMSFLSLVLVVVRLAVRVGICRLVFSELGMQ